MTSQISNPSKRKAARMVKDREERAEKREDERLSELRDKLSQDD